MPPGSEIVFPLDSMGCGPRITDQEDGERSGCGGVGSAGPGVLRFRDSRGSKASLPGLGEAEVAGRTPAAP